MDFRDSWSASLFFLQTVLMQAGLSITIRLQSA